MTTLFISHSSKDKEWALQIHKALQDQGYDGLFLDSHPDNGILAGAKWEQELWRHLRRSGAIIVLCTANWLASPWCIAEVMIARERGKTVFILASIDVKKIPNFLSDTKIIRFPEEYGQLWPGLAVLNKKIFPLPPQPYPGLMAFDKYYAAVFFGRDKEIDQVIAVLNQRRHNNAKGFILVLGASGCGKSSLVRAGVLPRLKRMSDKDGVKNRWLILQTVMAAGRGIEGVAATLDEAFQEAGKPSDLPARRRQLKAGPDGGGGAESAAVALCELATDLLAIHRVQEGLVLLVLDQLEEVFATREGSEARAGLQMLLEASAREASSMVVLATMRSDFLNEFQLFEGAAERYVEIPLDPMAKAHFGEIIEGPAKRFGLSLGVGFSERLVEDTGYSNALPLLAFTLERLYTECGVKDGELTLKRYEKLFPEVQVQDQSGTTVSYRGVSAAIKHVADEALKDTGYAGLPVDDQRMHDLLRAFYNLVQVGEEGQFTRQIAHWSQMPHSCADVLNRFVIDRLLVSGADDNGEPTLSVAHEALFSVWDRLAGWLNEKRSALLTIRHLRTDTQIWIKNDRHSSYRWSHERVREAVAALMDVRLELQLSDEERDFLDPIDRDIMQIELQRPKTTHRWRSLIGERLDVLGDPRRGVGVDAHGTPDISIDDYWCAVPGGEIAIQDEEQRKWKKQVDSFQIARYLITVAQYRAFLEAEDGWHNEKWWEDDLFRDPEGDSYDIGRFGNHPAVFVSWFDAMAFCCWLNSRLPFTVRLPNEWEWQQAATGGNEKNVFPWGADWEPHRANLREALAVGMYPAGASPQGALDMAGVIWEWCVNRFDTPDEIKSEAGDLEQERVLRSGSWAPYPKLSECSERRGDKADERFIFSGFRVARDA